MKLYAKVVGKSEEVRETVLAQGNASLGTATSTEERSVATSHTLQLELFSKPDANYESSLGYVTLPVKADWYPEYQVGKVFSLKGKLPLVPEVAEDFDSDSEFPF